MRHMCTPRQIDTDAPDSNAPFDIATASSGATSHSCFSGKEEKEYATGGREGEYAAHIAAQNPHCS